MGDGNDVVVAIVGRLLSFMFRNFGRDSKDGLRPNNNSFLSVAA